MNVAHFDSNHFVTRQVEHLKALLLTGRTVVSPSSPSFNAGGRRSETAVAVAEAVERERQLAAALIHSAEQERDELRLRHDEFAHALRRYEADNGELRERIAELEDALRAAELKSAVVTRDTLDIDEEQRLELVGVTTRKKASVDKDAVSCVGLMLNIYHIHQ